MFTVSGPQVDGSVNYRLARMRAVNSYQAGHSLPSEVCDAQPELRRVAHHHGTPLEEFCPICESNDLVWVMFAFGRGLPKSGRCVSGEEELAKIRSRKWRSECYRIEVCRQCWWNHVLDSFVNPAAEIPNRD